MAIRKSTPAKAASRTISLALVELRCDRASIEIDRVCRLLRVATGAILADESDCEPFKLPEDAIMEVLELAGRRLDAVSESLDCVRLNAEPTEEERKRVASREKIMRQVAEGKAARSAGVSHG